mmetsp:Transcript_107462/g.186590  ORF Transcript_107462/g.186590 Transcript_107462/m.186590 type:complete len:96 (-) Transcript_107462:325-612(-)
MQKLNAFCMGYGENAINVLNVGELFRSCHDTRSRSSVTAVEFNTPFVNMNAKEMRDLFGNLVLKIHPMPFHAEELRVGDEGASQTQEELFSMREF